MATWPTDLPQVPLENGYSEEFADTSIRSSMDVGPGKVRRRISAGAAPTTHSHKMTTAQVAILESFYLDTLSSGALPFNMTHPRKLTTASFRFKSAPKPQPAGGDYWLVSLNLEVLP